MGFAVLWGTIQSWPTREAQAWQFGIKALAKYKNK